VTTYSYEELVNKSNEDLLNVLAKEGGAPSGSSAGGLQTRHRELAKAILNHRTAKITETHNTRIFWLTVVITLFTITMTILTALLAYKEFFAN